MKKFFVNLYEKFIHLSWVEWTIDYCKENPLWAGLIGGLVVLIVALLCVMGGVRRKRKKARKAAEKAAQTPAPVEEKAAEPAPIPAPVAEKAVEPVPVEEKVAPVEEKAVEPAPVEDTFEAVPIEAEIAEVVDEPAAEECVEEPVEECVEEPVEEVAPAAVETIPVQEPVILPVVEKKALRQKQGKAKDMDDVLAAVENAEDDENDPFATHYDEDETEKQAKYKGKWTICRVLTNDEESEEMYFFELRASNGEKLLSSEEYTTYQGALRGIETHRANILRGNLKLTLSKKGDYIFKLLSGKNMLLCMGENYPTKARCESAMESTVRFAETAILDENVQDIVIKVPEEEDTPLPTISDNGHGKWIITEKADEDGNPLFFFALYANNGEKLLSSEEYTTYTGAINGIETHRKNIKQNNFRISLTKRGDYIYKLLNGNGQLLCLGEHYKTKRLCQSAVESVQRFALNSPVLTEKVR